MIRELLLQDFGKDLKVSGGMGNSIDDPIIIDSQSPHDASWTKLEVIRCIYARMGWHWRVQERSRVGALEKLSCEVKYAEGDQVITEKRNFYFELSKIDINNEEVTPACGVNLGGGTGMGLPYELGWLHFDQLTNYEENHPGLGVSAAYGAPFTKATIFVYNKGLQEINSGSESLLEQEFESAMSDVVSAHSDAVKIAERRDGNVFFSAFEIGSAYSIVTLSVVGGHFFKVRATLERPEERYAFECLWDSVNLILSMVSQSA